MDGRREMGTRGKRRLQTTTTGMNISLVKEERVSPLRSFLGFPCAVWSLYSGRKYNSGAAPMEQESLSVGWVFREEGKGGQRARRGRAGVSHKSF